MSKPLEPNEDAQFKIRKKLEAGGRIVAQHGDGTTIIEQGGKTYRVGRFGLVKEIDEGNSSTR